ncbi:ATP-dependent RecD-like DNA helicase [Synechococcus sp. PCC 7336]|uniref:ATP-dependent DNA helicase n=1 Tax=Synechococcus sp. PCC 7336 TaxID=195250 RepID=UPI00034A1ADF|nr:AAA family ATPase [Synechococcus sp. PCC 7336]
MAFQTTLLYFAYCGRSSLSSRAIAREDRKLSRIFADRLVKGGQPLSAAEETQAFEILQKYRQPLTEAGVSVPNSLPDRLAIQLESEGMWRVVNERQGTAYSVTFAAGQGNCTCPQFRLKHNCKHLAAVVAASLTETEAEAQGDRTDVDTAELDTNIPAILPGITLTQQQWQALQELEEFLHSDERLYLLTGYAGTGKSTLLQALIQRLRSQGDDRAIALTAFTNKAKKVLESMAVRWGLAVECLTCCQLLGIRPVINPQTGQQEFKPERGFENQIDKFALVVIDESSTIGEEMWGLLLKAVSGLFREVKLLFVGDPAQLPPVNEAESPCFKEIARASHLTEVVRYGNAIGLVAERLRQTIDRPALPRFQTQLNAQASEGVEVLDAEAWHRSLIDVFVESEGSADFDRVRALAYTNRRVEQLNRTIRQATYGVGADRFVVGERLIAHNPCLKDETILLTSSAECTVLEVRLGRVDRWQVWALGVEDEEGRWRQLQVLHEAGRAELERRLKQLAESLQWGEFWALKNQFHDLRYAYALTVHKAQGSSFEAVYVDVRNFAINRSALERNKLCYVALTRASKRVLILQ